MAHEELIQQIQQMTVLELSQFVKELETVLGVSAAAPMMMAGPMAGGGGAAAPAEPVEEQTEFDVVLKSVGEKKINVIKVVRALTNLGLKEAKDLVDGAPQTVKAGVSKDEAATVKAKLEAEGATVEVK